MRREAEAAAFEAERKIAEAEEAIADSNEGVVDDLDAKITEANEAWDRQQAASRDAARAARNARPILRGAAGSISMRTKKTLVVDDIHAAIRDMEDAGVDLIQVRESLLTVSRSFRVLTGRLPAGISEIATKGI